MEEAEDRTTEELVGDYEIADYEKCESLRNYELLIRMFTTKTAKLEFIQKVDGVLLHHPERGFNKSFNPIIHSLNHPNGSPEMIYALIEHHHLRIGQSTDYNQELAKQTRENGFKIDGVAVDLCGQIISAKLGGLMEKRNLFPVSLAENINEFKLNEMIMLNFIEETRQENGRVFLRAYLEYNDQQYPCRPTKLHYSYLTFSDDVHGQQKIAQNEYEEIFFEVNDESGQVIPIQQMNTFLAKHRSTVKSQQILDAAKKEFESLDNSILGRTYTDICKWCGKVYISYIDPVWSYVKNLLGLVEFGMKLKGIYDYIQENWTLAKIAGTAFVIVTFLSYISLFLRIMEFFDV